MANLKTHIFQAPVLHKQPGIAMNKGALARDYYLSGILLILKDDRQAMIDFSKAIEIEPDYAKAYYQRARAFSSMGNKLKAIADYTRSIELEPNFANAYISRGNIYLQQGDYSSAIADYTRAVKIQPNHYAGYYNRAVAHSRQKNWNKALADYARVIRMRSDNADAHYARGRIYHYLGQYTAALSEYQHSALSNRNFWSPLFEMGSIEYEIGSQDKAILQWQQALMLARRQKSNIPEAQLALAVAFDRKGHSEKALELAKMAVKLKKELADFSFLREMLWGEILLEDAKALFSSPAMKAFLADF